MTIRKTFNILLAASIVGMTASSCSSDSAEFVTIEDTSGGDVAVTGFSLEANANIAANLDSVYFSIDLDNAVIENYDSLPVGTRLAGAIAKITYPTVSKVEVSTGGGSLQTKTFDYIANPNDSINLAAPSVKVRVVSANTQYMREYTVKVNVHKLRPDTMYFDPTPVAQLPGGLTAVTAQKTVLRDGLYHTLTTDGASFSLAKGVNPGQSDTWAKESVSLPAGAETATFTATAKAFYIIAGGKLFESADAATWSDTGAAMTYIYGPYGDSILGVKAEGGSYTHVTYPATAESPVPAGCPVSGTSALECYDSEWSESPMAIFTGGRCTDGSLSGSSWGYDGTKWANLSVAPMPAREGIATCNYYTISVSNQFKVTTTPVLYAFGGKGADGACTNELFVSRDRGVHWTSAPRNLTFPATVPALWGAQAVVCESTLNVPASRATKPITSWQCPYIYILGGESASGELNTGVWRGLINYFGFIPVQ